MRTNGFGDKYCHSVAEARTTIENSENGWAVYATEFSAPEPGTNNKWDNIATCEIRENVSGDMVCYLEAPTLDAVKAMVTELKLKDSWG